MVDAAHLRIAATRRLGARGQQALVSMAYRLTRLEVPVPGALDSLPQRLPLAEINEIVSVEVQSP